MDDALFGADGLFEEVEELHPLARAGNEIDAKALGLVGVGLDIAAAGGHHRLRAGLFGPADHLAGFFIADGSDGAGVDDVSVGSVGEVHQRVAPALQLRLHGRRFILIDLAAKGVNGNSHGDSPCTLGKNCI